MTYVVHKYRLFFNRKRMELNLLAVLLFITLISASISVDQVNVNEVVTDTTVSNNNHIRNEINRIKNDKECLDKSFYSTIDLLLKENDDLKTKQINYDMNLDEWKNKNKKLLEDLQKALNKIQSK